MLRIAVCHTQKSDRAKIKEYCHQYFRRNNLEYEVQEFTSGESFLETDFPDILFIDVQLEKMSGLLVKEILELKRADTKLIFVSREEKEMSKAFGRNVYGFFPKNFSFLSFTNVMKRVTSDVIEERACVFCKRGNDFEKIYREDIMYLESYGRYTKIYIRGDESYRLSDKCIGDWCIEVAEWDFACCHRCYVVNLAFVKSINAQVELQNGVRLPIGENKKSFLKKKFQEYIWRNCYGEYDEKIF